MQQHGRCRPQRRLVKAGDATELNALVEETKQLDLSKYTVESADAIRQAISDAGSCYRRPRKC